jgi:hypothetical protein
MNFIVSVFSCWGVIINTSEEYNDYVDIRNFDVIETKSLEPFKPKSILELDAFKNL